MNYHFILFSRRLSPIDTSISHFYRGFFILLSVNFQWTELHNKMYSILFSRKLGPIDACKFFSNTFLLYQVSNHNK